jgi:hypothetical protein
MVDRSSSKPSVWKDLDIPALEADVAYFEARLSLVNHHPDSLYQRAQLRAYSALEDSLSGALETLRRGRKSSK